MRRLLHKLRLAWLSRLSRLTWMRLPLLLLKHSSLWMSSRHHRLLDIYHLKSLRWLLRLLRLWYGDRRPTYDWPRTWNLWNRWRHNRLWLLSWYC